MKNAFYGGSKLLDAKGILKKLGLTEGMIVADLGCGISGHFCCPAAHFIGDKGVIYAVDIRKAALDNIKSRARGEGIMNIKTIWSDLELYGSTDIASFSIDVVLLVNVLFQTKKDFEVLKEAVRLLKKGGKLLIIDWKEVRAPSIGPAPNLRVKRTEIQSMTNSLKLEQIDDFSAGEHHFGMIFEK